MCQHFARHPGNDDEKEKRPYPVLPGAHPSLRPNPHALLAASLLLSLSLTSVPKLFGATLRLLPPVPVSLRPHKPHWGQMSVLGIDGTLTLVTKSEKWVLHVAVLVVFPDFVFLKEV